MATPQDYTLTMKTFTWPLAYKWLSRWLDGLEPVAFVLHGQDAALPPIVPHEVLLVKHHQPRVLVT